ncbi:MAG: extracellular solute-binding protein [bacterium]|nr:extracellular solute-binding protein [bacterium]
MKKRWLALGACAALTAATVLSGCGGGSSSTTTTAAGGADTTTAGGNTSTPTETVELELLISDDTLEGGAMATVVAKFNEEFKDKGIQVKLNEIAYADMQTQIQNRAAVGELPALVKLSNFDNYIDYVLPLDDSSLSQDDFLRDGTRNGHFYGTSVNNTAVGMIINKTAFDNAGVSYPTTEEERWTWDEFEAAVKEVVEKNDNVTTGLVIDHSQQRIDTVLYSFGMGLFDPADETKLTFKSDATKKGLEYMLSMYQDGGISKASVGVGTENAQDVFKTGTVAAHLAGNWVMNDYSANISSFEWCPVLMPYDTYKATSLGGNWFYAMDGTGVEEESIQFLEWFYEPENYTLYCETGNYLPGRKGIEPSYTVEGLDIFNMEINASIDQPEYDTSVLNKHSGEDWGQAVRDAMDRAIAGEMDADGVMDYVVGEMESALSGVTVAE